MEQFKQILVCTDFSEAGNRAVETAFRLCCGRGATVIVMHAIEPPPVPNPHYPHTGPVPNWDETMVTRVRGDVTEKLRAMVPAEASESGVELRIETPVGTPVNQILHSSEKYAPDVVVLGTHGHTGLKRLLLGSVTERVVRLCDRPVLVVH